MRSSESQRDERLHSGLTQAGPRLSQPTTPPDVRGRIERLVADGLEPAQQAARLSTPRLMLRCAPLMAAAACLVLLVNWNLGQRRQIAGLETELAAARMQLELSKSSIEQVESARLPRYVLVNFHADSCLRARVVTPVFTEMRQRLAEESLMFVQLDLTDDARRQTRRMTRALGIEFVLERDPGWETGKVKLIDTHEQKIVSVAQSPSATADLEALVRQYLADDKP